jgi:hypothetical protein
MCSLVTPEFMHAQHEACFGELTTPGLDDERLRDGAQLDEIVTTRRSDFWGAAAKGATGTHNSSSTQACVR